MPDSRRAAGAQSHELGNSPVLEEAAAFDSFEEAEAFAAKQRRVYEECASN